MTVMFNVYFKVFRDKNRSKILTVSFKTWYSYLDSCFTLEKDRVDRLLGGI